MRWLPFFSILDGVEKAKRMPMIEVAPDLWANIRSRSASATVDGSDFVIAFAEVPKLQRVLTSIKESAQYAAWLKKEGLA